MITREVAVVPCTRLSMHDLIDTLRNVTIFSGFSDDDLRELCSNCSLYEARIGEVIVEEGAPATEILILLEGLVTVVLNLKEDPIEIMEFVPGYCIGEASVIGIQSHSASAVVIKDATLMVLPRQVLMNLFEEDKSLFSLLILNIARELARRLRHTDQVLLHYGKSGIQSELSHPGAVKKLQNLV